METFIVTLDKTNGVAKDPHPLSYPQKPQPISKDYPEQLIDWQNKVSEWERIDANLKRYQIENLVCDSGIKIDAQHINFSVGENRNAVILENGNIEVSSLKKK